MRAALWHGPLAVLEKGTNAMICSVDHIVTYLIISFVSVTWDKPNGQTMIKLFRPQASCKGVSTARAP